MKQKQRLIEQYHRRHTLMFSITLFPPMLIILHHFINYPLEGHSHRLKEHYHRGNISSTLSSPTAECTLLGIGNHASAMPKHTAGESRV